MAQHGVERRRVNRRSLAYYMMVLDANTLQTIGHLVDITSMGLSMDTPKQFPVGQVFRLRLDLNRDLAQKDHLDFTARSKWCRPDITDPFLFVIGFSIEGIAPSDVLILKRIADIYSKKDPVIF